MGKIKIGIIGSGGIGRHMLAQAKGVPEAKFNAIADVNEQSVRATAEEFRIPEYYTDYRQMLKKADIEAVYIGLPNFLHALVAIDALRAGKHVLCEKPPAMNAVEVRQMISAAKKSGKILMFAFCRRYSEESMLLKKMIDSGELGEIYYARGEWMRRIRGIGPDRWFSKKKMSGGGPMIDLGVHVLDQILYMMDFPEPAAVTGAAFTKLSPGVDVEDLASAHIRFKNGAVIALTISEAANVACETLTVKLLGTKAGAEISNPLKIFTSREGRPVDKLFPVPQTSVFAAELKHFLECIKKRKEPVSNGKQGLRVMEIIDAIYWSARTGKEKRFK